VDHVVDLVRVDLAVAVARERFLDAVDELRELGLVIAGDALAPLLAVRLSWRRARPGDRTSPLRTVRGEAAACFTLERTRHVRSGGRGFTLLRTLPRSFAGEKPDASSLPSMSLLYPTTHTRGKRDDGKDVGGRSA